MTPPRTPALPATPPGSSPSGSSTSPPATSSDETADASPNGSPRSSTSELLRGLDISRFSPKSRATLILIGDPVLDGWKETELASRLGRTPSWVSERLSELRTEILLQNGIFPPLTPAEYETLRDSIKIHGIRQPILVDENLAIIDGRHRLRAALETGRTCRFIIAEDLSRQEKQELEVALNAARRHLNRQQKRKLAEFELMRDPARSDRRVAAIVGVHHETVAAIRRDLNAASSHWAQLGLPASDAPPAPGDSRDDGDVAESGHDTDAALFTVDVQPAERIDSVGRRQPARRRAAPIAKPKAIAALACPCCNATLTLIRTAGTYTLEHPTIDAA